MSGSIFLETWVRADKLSLDKKKACGRKAE